MNYNAENAIAAEALIPLFPYLAKSESSSWLRYKAIPAEPTIHYCVSSRISKNKDLVTNRNSSSFYYASRCNV